MEGIQATRASDIPAATPRTRELRTILARAIHDWSVIGGDTEDSEEMHASCLLQAAELVALMDEDDANAMNDALLARRPMT